MSKVRLLGIFNGGTTGSVEVAYLYVMLYAISVSDCVRKKVTQCHRYSHF
jgi:hypothetical protein